MPWFPGEGTLQRFWETVERLGIGLASPLQIRREGKAKADVRRYEKLSDAKLMKDLDDVAQGRKIIDDKMRLLPAPEKEKDKGAERIEPVLFPRPVDADNFLEVAHQRQSIQAARELMNLRRIAAFAEEAVEERQEEPLSDKSVDPDWLSRWQDGAKNVSTEELQRLWAQALASETLRPGTYSLRTIEFLRSVTKQEAELIQRIAPYMFGDNIITGVGGQPFNIDHGTLFERHSGTTLVDLLALQEIGILSGAGAIPLGMTISNNHGFLTPFSPAQEFNAAMKFCNYAMIIHNDNPDTKLDFKLYRLTRVATEIKTLGVFEADQDYIIDLARDIMQITNSTVTVGATKPLPEGGFQLINPIRVAPIVAPVPL
jgi:hypothetical protein